jgi:hypothetical protein
MLRSNWSLSEQPKHDLCHIGATGGRIGAVNQLSSLTKSVQIFFSAGRPRWLFLSADRDSEGAAWRLTARFWCESCFFEPKQGDISQDIPQAVACLALLKHLFSIILCFLIKVFLACFMLYLYRVVWDSS